MYRSRWWWGGVVGLCLLTGAVAGCAGDGDHHEEPSGGPSVEGPSVEAATYYVAPNGDDGTSCSAAQHPSSPKRTIRQAIGCLHRGDTVTVADGTYQESILGDDMPNGGGSQSYTTVQSTNPHGAVLTGVPCLQLTEHVNKHWLKFAGFQCDYTNVGGFPGGMLRFRGDQGTDDILYTGIELHHLRGDNVSSLNQSYTTSTAMSLGYGSPTNVIVDNMDIHDIGYNQPPGSSCNACYAYGTYIGKGFTIQHSRFTNIAGFSIHGYSSGLGGGQNITLLGNVFTNTGAILLCQTGNKVTNNILNKVGQGIGGGNGEAFQVGIQLAGSCSGQPSSNNVIDNNTIYQAKGVCMDLGYTSNSTVQNNICYQTGHDAITGGTGGGNTVDHNLLGVDPHFVQAGADFHLQDGSPAINAAVCLNRVSDDIAGFARPGARGCAAGAYEFGSTGTRPE